MAGFYDASHMETTPMPKPVTLNFMPKSFGDGYFWVAALQGNEETGPLGLGNSPTEAFNELVDVTEAKLALRATPTTEGHDASAFTARPFTAWDTRR